MSNRLAAAAAALVSAALFLTTAEARPRRDMAPAAGSGPTVDVSRLRALGLGPTADLVQRAVADELASGGLPPAPGRVVVRLTGLSLNAYAGGEGDGGGGAGGGGGGGNGTNTDYLEGEILVVGPGGEILSRRPQLSAVPANSGGAYYLPGAEQRRIVALSRHFAAWLRRGAL